MKISSKAPRPVVSPLPVRVRSLPGRVIRAGKVLTLRQETSGQPWALTHRASGGVALAPRGASV